jgi:hypothetical protein
MSRLVRLALLFNFVWSLINLKVIVLTHLMGALRIEHIPKFGRRLRDDVWISLEKLIKCVKFSVIKE